MPPKHVKKEVEEKAVAVATLFMMLLAVAAYAQQADVPKEVQAVGDWARLAIKTIQFLLALGFWGAVGILLYHAVFAKLAPTRFQRLGALWDALERAKDVLISMGWLFLLIYGIYAGLGYFAALGGGAAAPDPVKMFVELFINPITNFKP